MNWAPEFWLRVADMGVGAVIALVVLLLGWRFLSVQRKDDREFKNKIATALDNHLSSISANQAKTAEALDLIVSRLLDAALRKPEDH